MPIEASSILSSLSGIGAIAREVFGDPSTPPAPPRPRPVPARTTPPINPFNTNQES
jgi:hypothetical protein